MIASANAAISALFGRSSRINVVRMAPHRGDNSGRWLIMGAISIRVYIVLRCCYGVVALPLAPGNSSEQRLWNREVVAATRDGEIGVRGVVNECGLPGVEVERGIADDIGASYGRRIDGEACSLR